MKSSEVKKGPADKARHNRKTLISHSDVNGNACPYDVWPYAEAWDRLMNNPKPDETKATWQPELGRLFDAHKKAKRKYKGPLMRAPDQQKWAAEACLSLKKEIDAGDGTAVLHAIAQCAAHGLVIPAWLAVAFTVRQQAVVYGDARDWVDAKSFGSPMRKGENVLTVRAAMQLAPWAYDCAKQLLADNPTRAIDGGLYADVANEIGSSSTNVQKWIKGYLRACDFYVPLKYFKSRLLAGRTADEAVADWDADRFRKFHEDLGMTVEKVAPKPRKKSQKISN